MNRMTRKFRAISYTLAFTAMLVLALSITMIAAAESITVDNKIGSSADYTSIQAAVNGAHEGDTILVYPGTYKENVNVNVENISIRSFSGNPEDTVVNANNSEDHVFKVTAGSIEISGFTLTGAGGHDSHFSGVYLCNISEGNISYNILLDNYYGIYLNRSSSNILKSNNALENKFGICLANFSNYNVLSENSATENNYGIYLNESCRNTLTGHQVTKGNWGIYLKSSSNYNTLVDNNVIEATFFGISLFDSSNNKLTGNSAEGNYYGIYLVNSGSNTLESNSLWGNDYGFLAAGDSLNTNTVESNNLADGKPIYYLVNASGVVLDSTSNAGIVYLIDCKDIVVRDLVLKRNKYSIYLENTTNSSLENNTLLNNFYGIYLCSSGDNTLTENSALYNRYGIFLEGSWNNTLNKNTVTGSSFRGIWLYSSNNTFLTENMVSLNVYGIDLGNSSNSTMVSNFMWDNDYNFHAGIDTFINGYLYGDYLGTNNVSSSNLVDGKPIYYLVNISEAKLDSSSNGGTIYLINCKSILIKDQLLENEGNCLCIYNTTNSILENNTISNNYRGIVLWNSSWNSLVGNRISSNKYFGISLKDSRSNTIYNNYFCNMDNSKLEGANTGNFWNATKTAEVNIVEGAFIGGNFWGTPVESGFSQKNLEDADGDGICDVYYSIDEYNVDYLPLQSFLVQYLTYNAAGEPATFPSIWNCTNCDFFFHEIVNGVETENLTVSTIENREIGESELVYRTEIKPVKYRYQGESWSGQTYPVMGFFGNSFVPLRSVGEETWETQPDKLARLLVDSKDIYSLKTGEFIYLGKGYALEAKQVDVEGDKVWLEFTRDGEFIDDEIVSVGEGKNGDWIVDLDDVEDEDDVIVMGVHVKRILENDARYIIQIEGIWLIDFANAFTIEQDEDFGTLEVTSIGGNYLELKNKQPIILERNSVQEIGEGFNFKVLDSPELIYYPFKKVTVNLEENILLNNFYPLTSEISTTEGGVQEFSLNTSMSANITLLMNGAEVKSENSSTFLSYRNSTASKGIYYIQATARTEDEEARHSWIWIVNEKDGDDDGSNSNNNKKSGGSSSSGGGGGGSPEPASNVESKELAQAFVTNGNHVKFEFKENATCIGCVEFDAKRTFGKTTTIVEMLKGKSKIVLELPSRVVYKNVNIWVGNEGMGTPENIENALIGFKVEKGWIIENGIDLPAVTLYRYHDSVWNPLPTVMAGEDKEYFYFTAETPGFSPFAIAGENEEVSIIPEDELEAEDMGKGSVDEEVSAPEELKEKKSPGFGTTFAIGVLLSVLYILKRK
ncbi:TPA: PGF-pre-PGF domain-containing protein [Methanosarcinaceae archaeon]|nr:PGF-pre-PGF domain-containing protein [Methanosarcinaceae archaeon]